jgi:hypothetical protein
LQISPAAKDVEGKFAFLLVDDGDWWSDCACLRGHCFLAFDLLAKGDFRVRYYARPFGWLVHAGSQKWLENDQEVAPPVGG